MRDGICVRCCCVEVLIFITGHEIICKIYAYLSTYSSLTTLFRSTAMKALGVMLDNQRNELHKQFTPAFKAYLDEADTLESLNFNIAHRIVAGMLPLSLEEQLDLHPHLIHETDAFGETPLLRALRSGDLNSAVMLLQRGANVKVRNSLGATPLHYAAMKLDERFCQYLLDAGADPNANDNTGATPLMYAADRGNPVTTLTLLKAGVDPNLNITYPEGISALVYAVKAGCVEVIKNLCRYGADVNIRFENWHFSTVMLAVYYNTATCVQFLIDKGAHLDLVTSRRDSVVSLAAAFGSVEIMRKLTVKNIRGLPIDAVHIQWYWSRFDCRDIEYGGQRAPVDVERAAFEELLDSIQPARSASRVGPEVDSDGCDIGREDDSDDNSEYVNALEQLSV